MGRRRSTDPNVAFGKAAKPVRDLVDVSRALINSAATRATWRRHAANNIGPATRRVWLQELKDFRSRKRRKARSRRKRQGVVGPIEQMLPALDKAMVAIKTLPGTDPVKHYLKDLLKEFLRSPVFEYTLNPENPKRQRFDVCLRPFDEQLLIDMRNAGGRYLGTADDQPAVSESGTKLARAQKGLPFGLRLDRQAVHRGNKTIKFGGRVKPWKLFVLMVNEHPNYCTVEMIRQRVWGAAEEGPEVDTIYQHMTWIRKTIRPIGLRPRRSRT
jgi:hypothetical protein